MFRLGNLLRRNYARPKDVPIWKHDQMVMMVNNFINCRQHLEFLKLNQDQVTPKILGDQLSQISGLELPLDEHWPEICKIVKEIIAEYNREAITDLFRIVRCVGELGERNQEFWELVETKLLKQGLCRYLNESEAAQTLWALCNVNRGSDELWKRLEKEVSTYYLSLEKDDLQDAIHALEVSGKGDENVILKLKSRLRAAELSLVV
jgi:hypothetical protein